MINEENAGREIMVVANQLKQLFDRHGPDVVSRVNRSHLKRYLQQVLITIDEVE